MDIKLTKSPSKLSKSRSTWREKMTKRTRMYVDHMTKQFAAFLAQMRSRGGQRDVNGEELVKMFMEFQAWQKQNAPKKVVGSPEQNRAAVQR